MSQYIEIAQGQYAWRKVVPVQLFEAMFLFILAGVLFWMYWKGRGFELPVYFAGYGVWRFIIEYFRTDDRGASFIPGLTPSQTTAIFLVAVGILIAVLAPNLRKKFTVPPKEAEEGGDNDRERSE